MASVSHRVQRMNIERLRVSAPSMVQVLVQDVIRQHVDRIEPSTVADLFALVDAGLESALGKEREGDWRLVPTQANRMPTAASYLRRRGDSEFRAHKLDVLRTEGGVIAEITTFDADLFPAFGLPPTL